MQNFGDQKLGGGRFKKSANALSSSGGLALLTDGDRCFILSASQPAVSLNVENSCIIHKGSEGGCVSHTSIWTRGDRGIVAVVVDTGKIELPACYLYVYAFAFSPVEKGARASSPLPQHTVLLRRLPFTVPVKGLEIDFVNMKIQPQPLQDSSIVPVVLIWTNATCYLYGVRLPEAAHAGSVAEVGQVAHLRDDLGACCFVRAASNIGINNQSGRSEIIVVASFPCLVKVVNWGCLGIAANSSGGERAFTLLCSPKTHCHPHKGLSMSRIHASTTALNKLTIVGVTEPVISIAMSLCRPPALSKSDFAGKELADTYLGEDGIYDLTAKVKSSVSSSNDNNGVLHGLLQIGNNISSSPKISVLSASGNPPTGSAAKLPLQTQDGHNKDDQGVLKPGAGGGGQICVMSVSFEKLGCPEAAVWCSVPIEPNQLRFAMLTDFDAVSGLFVVASVNSPSMSLYRVPASDPAFGHPKLLLTQKISSVSSQANSSTPERVLGLRFRRFDLRLDGAQRRVEESWSALLDVLVGEDAEVVLERKKPSQQALAGAIKLDSEASIKSFERNSTSGSQQASSSPAFPTSLYKHCNTTIYAFGRPGDAESGGKPSGHKSVAKSAFPGGQLTVCKTEGIDPAFQELLGAGFVSLGSSLATQHRHASNIASSRVSAMPLEMPLDGISAEKQEKTILGEVQQLRAALQSFTKIATQRLDAIEKLLLPKHR